MTTARLSASEILAKFACSFDPSTVSDEHLRVCARAIADTFAVSVAGSKEPAAIRVRRYIQGLAGGFGGEQSAGQGAARLWGLGVATTVEGAALYNGVAAHVLDFDDASSSMGGHPSVALLPALIALAESRDIGGVRLASSYVVGYEIASKLGSALSKAHSDRGWHMTSSVGTIAAAAACAHLLALDFDQTVSAIGLAVSQTAGTRQSFGFDAKSFQAGQCGAAALRATLLAEQGFTASALAMDGQAGYTRLYSESEDISRALVSLNTSPLEIDRVGVEIKKYPACYAVHRPLDGLFDLKREFGFGLDDVETIDIEVSYGTLSPLLQRFPENGVEGKFSMEYAIAAALEDGEIRLSTFTDEAVRRPELRKAMACVKAHEEPGEITPRWAEISVALRDGRRVSRRVDTLRGDASNPLADDDLLAKLADCLAWADSPIDAKTLYRGAETIGTASVRDVLNAIERTNITA
ncbi:MmgE/PrpD family protein [Paraburkholderia silviterrae]|uniref:MmgE/PrpD family protein n=1 Tax=Paraburkholderia silviterrae TaxID=2528715 RepID=A0A4R5M2W2_9BURK|nr:MmgE/PrpD family protein [Paraburkholderia silviterrae]TDG19955.1 MmgE/PrpD family protein [Paraburkholderia silviterrae]